MEGMVSKFLGNIKDWRLFQSARLIWFCKTAKLNRSVLSNFKRNFSSDHISTDVWRQTTRSGMHFPAIQTYKIKNFSLGPKHEIFIRQSRYPYRHSPCKIQKSCMQRHARGNSGIKTLFLWRSSIELWNCTEDFAAYGCMFFSKFQAAS